MRWLLLCLIAIQAASCGQKGPLTLPDGRMDPARAATSALHPAPR